MSFLLLSFAEKINNHSTRQLKSPTLEIVYMIFIKHKAFHVNVLPKAKC